MQGHPLVSFPMTWVNECRSVRASMTLGDLEPSGHVWTATCLKFPQSRLNALKEEPEFHGSALEAFSHTPAPGDPSPCFPFSTGFETTPLPQVLARGWEFRDKTHSLLPEIPQPGCSDRRF